MALLYRRIVFERTYQGVGGQKESLSCKNRNAFQYLNCM